MYLLSPVLLKSGFTYKWLARLMHLRRLEIVNSEQTSTLATGMLVSVLSSG